MAKCDLVIDKGLFSRNFSVDFRLTLPLLENHLPILVDTLINDLIPLMVLEGASRNIKGRDRGEEPLLTTSAEELPLGDELVAVIGESYVEERNRLTPQKFSLSLLTKFRDFPKASEIEFETNWLRQGAIPNWLNPQRIGRAFPIKISRFRIGFDIFYPKGLALFGTTPVVGETVLIESSEKEVVLVIRSSRVREREELPVEKDGIGLRIDQALARATGEGWVNKYRERLNER